MERSVRFEGSLVQFTLDTVHIILFHRP